LETQRYLTNQLVFCLLPQCLTFFLAIEMYCSGRQRCSPPGRVHFSLVPRHCVPGYFRLVPPGQDTLFCSRIFLKLALMAWRDVAGNAQGAACDSPPKFLCVTEV
jgi:hypothetical protein